MWVAASPLPFLRFCGLLLLHEVERDVVLGQDALQIVDSLRELVVLRRGILQDRDLPLESGILLAQFLCVLPFLSDRGDGPRLPDRRLGLVGLHECERRPPPGHRLLSLQQAAADRVVVGREDGS
eukprot:scaffold5910_cov239-Pinguiococcus_pyrenoidosus.AAC.2